MSLLLLLSLVAVIAIIAANRKRTNGGTARPGRARPELSVSELAATLQRGDLPAPIAASFPMRPGETCVGVFDADVEQWLEGDGTYVSKHVGWFGGIAGLVVGSAVTAVGNARRRAAAARVSAERWRMVGHYRIYVTTERVAMADGQRGWHEFWISDIRQIRGDHGSVVLQAANGSPAMRIHAAPATYWCMLLRRLAFNERPAIDSWSPHSSRSPWAVD